MRIVCVDIVVRIEIYRVMALRELRRALQATMVAGLTLDARLITVTNQRLAATMAHWLFIEKLFGPPRNKSYE
jgi:hypothetical protein